MAFSIAPILLLLLLTFTHVQSNEQGYITAQLSNKGLDFLKDILIEKAETSLVPLELPKIEKGIKIPFLGSVHIVLSEIVIERINVTSSTLKKSEGGGIVIDVSGAVANLSMNWRYEYSGTWLLPVDVTDQGSATIQVEGLEIGLTLSLKAQEGSLNLSLLDCGCVMNDISINLDGGASWLYQGLIDAFEDKIGAAVEDAVPKKLNGAIVKLDSLLQSLPKEVPIADFASLNATFIDDPESNEESLNLEINGLLSAKNEVTFSSHHRRSLLQDSASCNDDMVKFSLHEDVLKSASFVYFESSKMHWVVDKVPDQSLLNTAGWRFIVPQLYKKYPNHDMNLNLSVPSPPIVEVENERIRATIPLDVVVDVLDDEEVIPVLCVSVVISTSVSADISGTAVAGSVKLNDFTMSLKWSEVGDLHMRLIQTLMSTTLKTVVLPYINSKLGKGFQLPVFYGYELQNPQILCTNSWIVVCSDVASV